MKCPMCGCQHFYVKDPDDEYETCEFELRDGKVEYSSDADAAECPEIQDNTETYCDKCSWHGRFKELMETSE